MTVCRDTVNERSGGNYTEEQIRALTTAAKNHADLLVRREGISMDQALVRVAELKKAKIEADAARRGREKLMNAFASAGIVSRTMSDAWKGAEAKGFRSNVYGVENQRAGARDSADAIATSLRDMYMNTMADAAHRIGKDFPAKIVRQESQEPMARAMIAWQTTKNFDGIDPEIVKFAKTAVDVLESIRIRLNEAGASIGKLEWHVVAQTHDELTIRNNRDEWFRQMTDPNTLDWDTISVERNIWTAEERIKFLESVWDNLAHPINRSDRSGSGSLAGSLNKERILHFKDADAWIRYHRRFGSGGIVDGVINAMENGARNIAMMEKFGPNPKETFLRARNEIAERIGQRDGQEARHKFNQDSQDLLNGQFAELLGELDMPAEGMFAEGVRTTAAVVASIQRSASLEKAAAASLMDLANMMTVAARSGVSPFRPVRDYLKNMLVGLDPEEQLAAMADCGVFAESFNSHLAHIPSRFDVQDQATSRRVREIAGGLDRVLFTASGQNRHTTAARSASLETLQAAVRRDIDKPFAKLSRENQHLLSLYDISPAQWDLIRQAPLHKNKSGTEFLLPSAMRQLPDDLIAAHLKSQGINPTAARMRGARENLEQRYRTMLSDQVNSYMVITPGADTRSISKSVGKPGQIGRWAWQSFWMFKSFTLTYTRGPMAREWYRFREFGDKRGALMYFPLQLALGYVALSAREVVFNNKEPPPLNEGDTYLRSVLASGGLGIYGDLFVTQLSQDTSFGSRSAETFLNFLGPNYADLGKGFDAAASIVQGDDAAARKSVKFIRDNAPLYDLPILGTALNHMAYYPLMEAANPGYIERMERAQRERTTQDYLIAPSGGGR